MRLPRPSFYTPMGDKNERKDIFENVDKRLSVSLTHLTKGVIRELNSIHLPWSCNGHFFNTGLVLSLHLQPFTSSGPLWEWQCLQRAAWWWEITLWTSLHFTIINTNSGKHYHIPLYPKPSKSLCYISQIHILDTFLERTQMLLYSRGYVKNKSCVFWPNHDQAYLFQWLGTCLCSPGHGWTSHIYVS